MKKIKREEKRAGHRERRKDVQEERKIRTKMKRRKKESEETPRVKAAHHGSTWSKKARVHKSVYGCKEEKKERGEEIRKEEMTHDIEEKNGRKKEKDEDWSKALGVDSKKMGVVRKEK